MSSDTEPRLSQDFSPSQRHYWTTHWKSDGPPRIVISDEDSFTPAMGQSQSALQRDSGGMKRPLSAPSPSHNILQHNDTPQTSIDDKGSLHSKSRVLRRLSLVVRRPKPGTPLRINAIKRRSALESFDPRRDSALTETSNNLSIPEAHNRTPTAEPVLSDIIPVDSDSITAPSTSDTRPATSSLSAIQQEDLILSEKVRALYDVPEQIETSTPADDDEIIIDHSAVDRYGFIITDPPTSRNSKDSNETTPPIREDSKLRSNPSTLRRLKPHSMIHKASRRSLRRTPSVISRARSNVSVRSVRSYTYLHLPQNHDKKIIYNAGSMLLGPSGMVNFPEKAQSRKQTIQQKKREWRREDKWRAMAKKVVNANGGGTDFQFDQAHPKLVERTWKGVPDRLRASVWWSFMKTASSNDPDADTEDTLMKAFYTLQNTTSPDDLQIDLDVPRTINHHEMFGQRYRGGQRLLFRVLHALSLYLPDLGYTQGMAAIAVTLLCYFPEERAFIMMIRIFKYRGLADLYKPGFEGLMVCLEQFEKKYLSKKPLIAAKLENLGISPTTYGTRWYLTLFNYSIPFHCQLRIWDLYMLLGFGVLHAASAALVDACREVLEMESSDFENAMKLLTGFITVKDEDFLIATTKAEWQLEKKAQKAAR
ncbi:RabGAP/TBC [Pseudovirgaria hyperparasitica]|uniref:RabGAP/TBC n=1 Tax=Pseudovirgaria hyperparasitica TaxID=470096 RepID=A0A6A6WC41_9PEZI|nr:RabGAP/TBC [Pseudovirgaria hyperparasitica]KAF2760145.1 RabGAP/TBC [Pseudovirgaria hyperparasitica]